MTHMFSNFTGRNGKEFVEGGHIPNTAFLSVPNKGKRTGLSEALWVLEQLKKDQDNGTGN